MVAISQAEIQRYLAEGDAAAIAYDKGRCLERAIKYAFAKVPGLEHYKSNIVNAQHSEEVDVAFFNNRVNKGLPFLEHLILIECKNWSQPAGAIHVREFATKLRHRACANGVLVAANGITGDAGDRSAAHDAVRMTLATEGIRILVITRAEMSTWTDSADVVQLFKKKLCELIVAGTIFLG